MNKTLTNGATAHVFQNCETTKHQLHVRYNGVLIGQAQDDSIETLLRTAQDNADQWLEAARKDLAA